MSPAKFLALKNTITIVLVLAIVGLAAYGIYSGRLNLPFNVNRFIPSPARDLRGTWISSLSGKGMELTGQFETNGSVTTIHENGDIELIINTVENGLASGTIRMFNVCASGFTVVPKYGTVTVPKTCFADTGTQPIEIGVSSSGLDFGTINAGDLVATMIGNFTTDLMNGTMTVIYMPYGQVTGVFHLMRKR